MIDPITAVAFTGHRHYRGEAGETLSQTLETLYSREFRTFLCGMALGFDLAVAEAVLQLRRRHPDVRLVAVVPFRGQAGSYGAFDWQRYLSLLAAADEMICLSENYRPGCYRIRNDWMVEHASLLVTWYDGSAGGTRYTVRRAMRLGRELVHLHPSMAGLSARDPELFE